MGRKYIDLYVALVAGKRVLLQAPWMSHIEIGSKVIYENGGLLSEATILEATDAEENDERINLLRCLAGYEEGADIPRIVKKIVEREVEYE